MTESETRLNEKLDKLNEKLDFLIFCNTRSVMKKGALGQQSVEVMPGEELFKQWKNLKTAQNEQNKPNQTKPKEL